MISRRATEIPANLRYPPVPSRHSGPRERGARGRTNRAPALATGVADANLPLTLAGVPLGVLDLAPVPDGSTAGPVIGCPIASAATAVPTATTEMATGFQNLINIFPFFMRGESGTA